MYGIQSHLADEHVYCRYLERNFVFVDESLVRKAQAALIISRVDDVI